MTEDVRIDIARLVARIEALGEIGAVHGPAGERGCARLALTDADREGRDLVVTWMRDLDLDVSIDAIGNVVATRPGEDPSLPVVMTGSHIDTVRTGGRFDGALQCFVLSIVVGPVANPVGLFGKLQPRMGERDPERPVVFVGVATGPTQTIVGLCATKLDRVH